MPFSYYYEYQSIDKYNRQVKSTFLLQWCTFLLQGGFNSGDQLAFYQKLTFLQLFYDDFPKVFLRG